jgi:hypothetical protein
MFIVVVDAVEDNVDDTENMETELSLSFPFL